MSNEQGDAANSSPQAKASRIRPRPDDLGRIVFAVDDGQDLVAIVHSHTHTPAVPSATACATPTSLTPFYLQATLEVAGASAADSLRAWRIRFGVSVEVPLRIH